MRDGTKVGAVISSWKFGGGLLPPQPEPGKLDPVTWERMQPRFATEALTRDASIPSTVPSGLRRYRRGGP